MKKPKDLQMKVRMMLPMTIQCKTCGNFIYKGTKFNSRKEDVVGEVYLGIQVFRFYFKCTRCAAELTIKTDPQNSDYAVEHGAKRTAEPWRDEEKQLAEEKAKRDKEEMGDAMRALENRTIDSRQEMDILAALDEMKSLKSRHFHVSTEDMLGVLQQRRQAETGVDLTEEDEAVVRSIFRKSDGFVRRLDDDEDEEGAEEHAGGAGPSSADARARGSGSGAEKREGKQVAVDGPAGGPKKAKRRPAAPLPVSAQAWDADDSDEDRDDGHADEGGEDGQDGGTKRAKLSAGDDRWQAGSSAPLEGERQDGVGLAARVSRPQGHVDYVNGDGGGSKGEPAEGGGGQHRMPEVAREEPSGGAGASHGGPPGPSQSATGFLETLAADAAGSKVGASGSDVSFAVKSRPVMFAVKQKPGQAQGSRQPAKQQVSMGGAVAMTAQPAAGTKSSGDKAAASALPKVQGLGGVLASYGSDEDSPASSS
eukprot:jgi/Mesvir1/12619/Mv09318-RA.1